MFCHISKTVICKIAVIQANALYKQDKSFKVCFFFYGEVFNVKIKKFPVYHDEVFLRNMYLIKVFRLGTSIFFFTTRLLGNIDIFVLFRFMKITTYCFAVISCFFRESFQQNIRFPCFIIVFKKERKVNICFLIWKVFGYAYWEYPVTACIWNIHAK